MILAFAKGEGSQYLILLGVACILFIIVVLILGTRK